MGSTAGSEHHVRLCSMTSCLVTRLHTLEEPCVEDIVDSVFDIEHVAHVHEQRVFLKDFVFVAFVVL